MAGPAGGNQGAGKDANYQLNYGIVPPPVTGALGVIGLSGRASYQARQFLQTLEISLSL